MENVLKTSLQGRWQWEGAAERRCFHPLPGPAREIFLSDVFQFYQAEKTAVFHQKLIKTIVHLFAAVFAAGTVTKDAKWCMLEGTKTEKNMLVLIIIIALFIGLFFMIMAIALGGYIYNGMKQNGEFQKKCLKILIPSAIVWLLLVVLNIVLVIVFLYNNGGEVAQLFGQVLELLKK